MADATLSSKPVDNPWREFIENVITGSNYFRASEYRDLLADLDRLYALEEAHAPKADAHETPDSVTDKQKLEEFVQRCDVLSKRLDGCSLAMVDLSNLDSMLAAKGLSAEREVCHAAMARIDGGRHMRSTLKASEQL